MKQNLFIVYSRNYKPYMIGSAVFIISFLICYLVIIPQWNLVQSKLQEIDQKKQSTESLRQSINMVRKLNAGNIDKSIFLVNTAIPNGKDIIAVYDAITMIAANSNVSIKNFSLKIGNLYSEDIKSSGQIHTLPATDVSGDAAGVNSTSHGVLPSLNVQLDIGASDSKKLFQFVDHLYMVLPLAEVSTIAISQNEGKFDVNFYYKPYSSNAFAQTNTLHVLTPQQQDLLLKLKSWQDHMQQVVSITPALSLTPIPAPVKQTR